jgi:hypothetical protein
MVLGAGACGVERCMCLSCWVQVGVMAGGCTCLWCWVLWPVGVGEYDGWWVQVCVMQGASMQ